VYEKAGLSFEETKYVEAHGTGTATGDLIESESFDLIIASNVLHATSDINRTMVHVRSILKPGGTLVMYEITRPEVLKTGFITDLLHGWWLGTEPERFQTAALSCEK